MKKPENSGRCWPARPLASGEYARPGRIGKARVVLIGALALVAAGGFLVLTLLPGIPEDPQTPRSSSQPARQDAGVSATVSEMEQDTFAVARRLMEDFPDSPDAMNLMANVQNQYDHTAEAAKLWQHSIQLDPRRINAHRGLAMLAMKKGNYEKAAEIWQRIRKRAAGLPDVNGRYGEALLEQGKPAEALAPLQEEILISPQGGEYHFLLGRAYLQLQEYARAAKCYEKAHDIRPRDSKTCYGLSVAYARSGQADKAQRMQDKFKSLRAAEDKAVSQRRKTAFNREWAIQTLTRTLTGAGIVYARNGKPKKAEEQWRRAAALDAKSRACRHALVDMYTQQGRVAEAVEICGQLQRAYPETADYHLRTGSLYARLKRWAPAEKAIRKAIALAPKEASGYRALIRVLMTADRKLPEARSLAQKLTDLQPNAQNYFLLGEVCDRIGDSTGALAARQRATELNLNLKRIK